MDIEQLTIFIRVATLKNFTRAAASLFLSQPTISARIKSLEEELGVVLFDRSRNRELTLTEEGIIFWDYAQQIVNNYNQAIDRLRQEKDNITGLLQIGASSVPGTYILPRILQEYKKEYHQVKTSVYVKDSAEIINDVANYALDIGMVGYMEDDPRLNYISIAKDELCLITPPGWLKLQGYKRGDSIPVDVLLNLDFIMREPGSATRKVLEQKLNEEGYTLGNLKSVVYMDSLEGIKQSVREGLGVSVVSKLSVEDYLSLGLVDDYNLGYLSLKRDFFVVYHKQRVLNNAASSFLRFMQNNNQNYEINTVNGKVR